MEFALESVIYFVGKTANSGTHHFIYLSQMSNALLRAIMTPFCVTVLHYTALGQKPAFKMKSSDLFLLSENVYYVNSLPHNPDFYDCFYDAF